MKSAEQARVAAGHDLPGAGTGPPLRPYADHHAALFEKIVVPRLGREPPTARAVDRELRRMGKARVEDLTVAECTWLLGRFHHVCAWCGARLIPQGNDGASAAARAAGLCARCWRERAT